MSEPILSIISPVYNVQPYLQEFLQAIADQKCPDIEHIVVDGGSEDGSVVLLSEFARKHPYVRWISQKDRSCGEAINKGIAMARGKYLGILAVNDFYEPETLQRVVKMFPGLPPLGFLIGNCKVLNEYDQLMYINKPSALTPWRIMLDQPFPYNPCAYFYDKKIHDKAGLYGLEPDHPFDLEFLLRAFNDIARVKYVDEIWGNFREMTTSMTVRWKRTGRIETLKKESYEEFLAELPLSRRMYYNGCMKIYSAYDRTKYFLKRLGHYFVDPADISRFLKKSLAGRPLHPK